MRPPSRPAATLPAPRRRPALLATRVIDAACLVVLVLVMATVVYGLFLRAYYERSYYAAAGVAIFGAVVMIVGLAQQAIAARDAATWREMAAWQIRASANRLEQRGITRRDTLDELIGTEDSAYYENLIESLIADMVREERGVSIDDGAQQGPDAR